MPFIANCKNQSTERCKIVNSDSPAYPAWRLSTIPCSPTSTKSVYWKNRHFEDGFTRFDPRDLERFGCCCSFVASAQEKPCIVLSLMVLKWPGKVPELLCSRWVRLFDVHWHLRPKKRMHSAARLWKKTPTILGAFRPCHFNVYSCLLFYPTVTVWLMVQSCFRHFFGNHIWEEDPQRFIYVSDVWSVSS